MAWTGRAWIWLVSGSALVLGAVIGMWIMPSEVAGDRHDFDFGTPRKSVVNLVMTVPPDKRDRYFEQMQEFAKSNELGCALVG